MTQQFRNAGNLHDWRWRIKDYNIFLQFKSASAPGASGDSEKLGGKLKR